ncbi:MAG TPA: LysR family transcriptional regulator [Thauera sp.]|nr:LysR family transcriptional regulator [Thauera sp.]HHW65330.1 LysR family transcriptional regulator [Rhodocyclaceae bacterium]
MNRLDAMNLFVRVADLGSFAAVANQLGVARSVVTRQIAALEEHLGVKLMVRTTRKLTLTSAGASYLDKCRSILDLVELAEADVMEARLTPRGNLRIGLPLSYGLKRIAPLLPAFLKTYPEISLALDFTDRHINLIDEGVDLSIRITPRLDPGDVARKLGETRLIAVASPAYLAHHGRPTHPSELGAHTCLGYSAKANNRPLAFLIDGRIENVHVPFRLQANNGDALMEAAAQGLGITMQPDFIANDYLARGAVVPVLEAFAPPPLGIHAMLPSNRYLPHRVRVLIDFLASELAKAP